MSETLRPPVLIIDDELPVAMMMEDMLEELGYESIHLKSLHEITEWANTNSRAQAIAFVDGNLGESTSKGEDGRKVIDFLRKNTSVITIANSGSDVLENAHIPDFSKQEIGDSLAQVMDRALGLLNIGFTSIFDEE